MRGLRRALFMSFLGAASGAIAAFIAYEVRAREPERPFRLEGPVDVRDVLISGDAWAIVGLLLLGFLVCGSVAAAYVYRKGLPRVLLAAAIAAPVGALLCWGARLFKDWLVVRSALGLYGTTELSATQMSSVMILPWYVWQAGVAIGLTLPVVLAIGVNRFTLLRGLLGAGLVVIFSELISNFLVMAVVAIFIGDLVRGQGPDSVQGIARITDMLYLFTMGAAAGLAFAVSEVVLKPAWLKSRGGVTEGRTWSLQGQAARIGSMEGNEVFLPQDGYTAPLHAQLQSAEEAHYLVDLGGGVTVNGQPVQSAWLKDGDLIGVGSHRLQYRTRLGSGGGMNDPAPSGPAPQIVLESAPANVSETCLVLTDPIGNEHPLQRGPNLIGRDPGCTIPLPYEASISRRHAEVTLSPLGVTVRDLGSTNGTFVNGIKITSETRLHPGDRLRLGKCELAMKESAKA
jgi:pSer/pThr/pTyr-binding forkhead associated (FHA) protein